MIRAIAPDDTTALLALAEATGLFQPEHIGEKETFQTPSYIGS